MTWRSVYLPLGEHFLNQNEVSFIEEQLKRFPLETIHIGDAGEVNNCQVGRLMEDQPQKVPKQMNTELSEPILKLYKSNQAKEFFSRFLKEPSPQYIRRSQFNLLGENSFVGRHLDIDSNPTYQIAAVLQLGSKFEGGEFAVYSDKESELDTAQVIRPEYGSLTISYCRHEHEVLTVRGGIRTSFVCFISNDNNKNPRVIK